MFFMKPESGKQFSEVILHVPHSSTYIPEEFADSFLCDLETEMTLMSDLYTDILFDCRHEAVVFPVSRLICDVERFRDDCDEPMSRVGMGAVYTRAHTGAPLRRTGEGERERILRRWYDPHHAELERQVGRRLDAFGKCLVIDCHSFSGVPLPHEPDKDPDRPDICVGTDGFHTPGRLADAAKAPMSSPLAARYSPGAANCHSVAVTGRSASRIHARSSTPRPPLRSVFLFFRVAGSFQRSPRNVG